MSAQNFVWLTVVGGRWTAFNAFASDDVWSAPPPRPPIWVGDSLEEALKFADRWSAENTVEYGVEVDRDAIEAA